MNNYIYEYYQAMTNGTAIVGDKIKKIYKQIIDGLQTQTVFYNAKRAKDAITFIEMFAHHHEGILAPGSLKLELWQKATLSLIFGIVDKDGKRQFREVFLVIGRKNGKSVFASAIAEYMMFRGEYGSQIYFCAPKLDQAAICYNGLFQMILCEPTLAEQAKKRRTDVYIPRTNTTARPLAFNARKSDGLSPTLAILDEIAAWHGDAGLKQYEVLKSAVGSRQEPLIISISTAGYENESIYDELFKRSTAVINGTAKEKRLLPLIYQIDDIEKWNDISELQKSNPNLGVSVSVDYLLDEIAIAESSLSKKSEAITKYANVKQNSSVAWIDAPTIMRGFGDALNIEDFNRCYGMLGIDLSISTDLTSCCLIIEKENRIHVFNKFWLPREKITEATARDGVPYDIYIKRGFLEPSGDNVIDYNDVFNWIKSLYEKHKIYILGVGYDRYNALNLTQMLEQYGFHCESVRQGENLTGIINDTEGKLKDGTFNFGDNDLMKIHLFESSVKINTETNRRRLCKVSSTSHIDGVAALLDAMTVRANHWAEYGKQLRNEGKRENGNI